MSPILILLLDTLKRLFFLVFEPEFTVRIQAGRAALVQGKLPQRVVDEFSSIAEDCRIERGTIYGQRENRRARLVFNTGMSKSNRQRFRNCFTSF